MCLCVHVYTCIGSYLLRYPDIKWHTVSWKITSNHSFLINLFPRHNQPQWHQTLTGKDSCPMCQWLPYSEYKQFCTARPGNSVSATRGCHSRVACSRDKGDQIWGTDGLCLEITGICSGLHMPEMQLYRHTFPDSVVGILYYYELLTALCGETQHMRIVWASALHFSRTYQGPIEAWLGPYQEVDTLAGLDDRTYNPSS